MYLSEWQCAAIEKCYIEKYSELKTKAEINEMVEAEISTIEDENDFERISLFVRKSKTIPTKNMEKDLESLNKVLQYIALQKREKFTPLERCEYKFNRAKLETLLKENRALLRSHKFMSPRQIEVLVNMGLDSELAEILPQAEFENYYLMLKDSNLIEADLFDEEKMESNRKKWLDPDRRKQVVLKGGELEF